MLFLIRETHSFNLMYVAACYPVGTTISKTSSLFTALLQHYKGTIKLSHSGLSQRQASTHHRKTIEFLYEGGIKSNATNDVK